MSISTLSFESLSTSSVDQETAIVGPSALSLLLQAVNTNIDTSKKDK